jgi:hypothetical protein
MRLEVGKTPLGKKISEKCSKPMNVLKLSPKVLKLSPKVLKPFYKEFFSSIA